MTERELTPLPTDPKIGSLWRHVKTGGVYRVVVVAYEESTLTPVVVYGPGPGLTGTCWTRPWSEFMDGRFVELL